MNGNNQNKVSDDTVVTMDYTLKIDGEVVDTSEGAEPIEFIQGHHNIISGLENELYGMTVGESRQVTVSPEMGYGSLDPEKFADVPRDQFPPQIPLQPGVELQLRDESGEVLDARIAEVGADTVRLDFNHPLAGKELNFSVTIVGLRPATEEELAHGHVHGNGMEEEDEEEDWDEDEGEGEEA